MDLQDRVILEFLYENLKDIPYEIAQIGVKKLLAEEKFYPNIAKIRKSCAYCFRCFLIFFTDCLL
ncbi:hypothetical protein [Defluviitalea raffinosedens]|uniref:hypothetical protein n=1 Tax=Defluviitalea raffinosedens TaxID=1450156 RepID=UPI001A9BE198|nr:hypothetical protein [Defluviitalea raffinosedens]